MECVAVVVVVVLFTGLGIITGHAIRHAKKILTRSAICVDDGTALIFALRWGGYQHAPSKYIIRGW